MVILVIGPSGVGKSACGEYAAETISGCQFFDLDNLVRARSGTPSIMELFGQIGPDAFLGYCQREAERLLNSPQRSTRTIGNVYITTQNTSTPWRGCPLRKRGLGSRS